MSTHPQAPARAVDSRSGRVGDNVSQSPSSAGAELIAEVPSEIDRSRHQPSEASIGSLVMSAKAIADRLAKGSRVQELSSGDPSVTAHRIFRIWTESGTQILKVYGSPARERRERHALTALRGIKGVPIVLDRGSEQDQHWALFEDGGGWSLSTLPENPGLARHAGKVLAAVHDADPAPMSNLERGIDQEWVTVDFLSTFRRLERYRGRVGLSAELLEAARGVRPPFASAPRPAHTNPQPSRFLVDDKGSVTLIEWEWATIAPPEWDLSRAVWLLGLEAGPAAASALQEGYGRQMDPTQLDRWTVYNAAMMLVTEAEERVGPRLAGLEYLVDELQRAVAGSGKLVD